MSFSCMAFVFLKYIPFLPNLLRILLWKNIKYFSAYIEMIIWFLTFNFLMWVYQIYWFVVVQPFLHPRNKFHLIVVSSPFCVLLSSVN